jgi:hypothetical protein
MVFFAWANHTYNLAALDTAGPWLPSLVLLQKVQHRFFAEFEDEMELPFPPENLDQGDQVPVLQSLKGGRCYDHKFRRFLPIFGEHFGVYVNNQCYDKIISIQ